MLIISSVFPALSCTDFKDSCFILRSLIHFELILVQGERHGSSFSFLHADIQFFQQTFVEKIVFSPWYVLSTFVKNQVGMGVRIYIWVFYFFPCLFLYECQVVFIAITL
jgi:hypothetical protein